MRLRYKTKKDWYLPIFLVQSFTPTFSYSSRIKIISCQEPGNKKAPVDLESLSYFHAHDKKVHWTLIRFLIFRLMIKRSTGPFYFPNKRAKKPLVCTSSDCALTSSNSSLRTSLSAIALRVNCCC